MTSHPSPTNQDPAPPTLPGVSVIIPAYNYARYLPAAIDSALAQQDHNGLPVEVVVVDDDSTDDTPDVCRGYGDRIRYVHQANAGLSASRNTGMRVASFDHALFLDADDLLPPGTVAVMIRAWRQQTDRGTAPALVAGARRFFDDGSPPAAPEPESLDGGAVTATDLLLRSQFPCTVLADRRILQGLGGFDQTLAASEDRDMWIRVAARHAVWRLDRVVLWNRCHGVQMSRHAERQTRSVRRVLDKAQANPDLDGRVPRRTWRQADAVCAYQEALMRRDAGDLRPAIGALLRSFRAWPLPMPWLDRAIGTPLCRERCLVVTICRWLTGR